MSETGGEIPQQQEPKLSKIEAFQAYKPARATSREAVIGLSTQITANPELHRQVAENPYSQQAQTAIAGDEQLRTANPSDVVRAIILAEPEGKYDVAFKTLPPEQKKEKLYQQIDSSADMLMRLSQHVNKHMQEFWTMTPEQMYTRLTEVAFDTADPQKVEEVYAQSQRRGFRLGIVNFIEGMSQFRPYQEGFTTNVKGTAQKILGNELQGTVKVESLPVGFVLYLEENDFVKVLEKRDRDSGKVIGTVLHEEEVSPDLAKKIVLIKTGSEDQQGTRDHEVEHLVFRNFLQDESTHLEQEVLQATTVEEHRKAAKQFKKSLQSQGKNEILAYTLNDNKYGLTFSELGIDGRIAYLNFLWSDLWRGDTLSPAEKTEVYQLYREQTVLAVEQLRMYEWMKDALFVAAGKEGASLTKEKVQALLELTPVDQAARLGRYLGFTEEEAGQQYQDHKKEEADRFKNFVSTMPASSDDPSVNTWETMHKALEVDVETGRKGFIPAILHAVQTTQNEVILKQGVDVITKMVFSQLHTLSFAELDEVQSTLESVLVKRELAQVSGEDKISTTIRALINGPIAHEHVDFVNNPPEWLKKEQETAETT
jgi:hypothetical protein